MTGKEVTGFYEAHSRRLYNMSYRILLSREDAEEVMQDTILKFVTMPFRPMSGEQVSAWLAKTCIRASIDRLRKRRRESLFLGEYAAEAAVISDTEITEETDAGRILEAIQKLPEPYRLVVNLILVEGLDYEETASYTGQKQSTLRSQYLRGKQKLMEILNKDGKQI